MESEIRNLIKAVAKLEEKVETLGKNMAENDKSMKEIMTYINKVKGGWIAIVAISGSIGALGALVTGVVQKISGVK